ncbi:MAG: hypothetical protein LQ344_001090 [Seirophora lacunosa]|nr:MAG: hypothetical protein LQ344_001090 [Seirophora lacunosa]
MNTLFNSALKQSSSIRRDLDAFAENPAASSPALQGQISASLTSLSRTIDDYSETAKNELIHAKQEKAYERIKNFRAELLDYRQTFDQLKKDREDSVRTSPAGPLGQQNHIARNAVADPNSSKPPKPEPNFSGAGRITPPLPKIPTPKPSPRLPLSSPRIILETLNLLWPLAPRPMTTPEKHTLFANSLSCRIPTPRWTSTWSAGEPY